MRRARILSLYGGTAVVGLWTFIRHITNGVNFDVVGQIGVAEQWVHGISSGVVLGQTNYLLKMPVFILINALHFISPMNRLLLLAIVFNVATFVILFWLLEKILKLNGVKDQSWLYLGMFWLATIAGNVYWLEYANSRNLETVGGIFLLYLVMKYLKHARATTAVTLAVVASIVFIADSLQLYICGGGAGLYVVGRWLVLRNQHSFKQMSIILGAILGGFVGSRVLSALSKVILPVSYLDTPNSHPALTFSNTIHALHGVGASLFDIFGADFFKRPYGPNTIRESLDLIVIAGIVVLAVRLVATDSRPKRFLGLLPSVIAANIIVYIASGQALEANTSRYLIMIPLLTITFVSLFAPQIGISKRRLLQQTWFCIVVLSTVLLLGALAKNWPQRYSKDRPIYQTITYLQKNNFRYALGWHGLGVTTTYFSSGHEVVLPISCPSNHAVHAINLFYDKGAFKLLAHATGDVPVILPNASHAVNQCSLANIVTAFGQPKRQQIIPGVGVAEVYAVPNIHLTY